MALAPALPVHAVSSLQTLLIYVLVGLSNLRRAGGFIVSNLPLIYCLINPLCATVSPVLGGSTVGRVGGAGEGFERGVFTFLRVSRKSFPQ